MSTWTSRRLRQAGLVAGLALLCACRFDPAAVGNAARADDPPPARMAVADGAIIIKGPSGFCIDRAASRGARGGTALAVLSSCQALGGGFLASAPRRPAILTATVAPDGAGLPVMAAGPELAEFLAGDVGRALLSRAGDTSSVTLLETRQDGDVLLLHLRDTATFPGGMVAPDYWRAFLELEGRALTLAVLAQPDNALTREDGLGLLRDFLREVRAATASKNDV